MSFAEVERAMIDLLFDGELRAAFARDRSRALHDYVLTEDERADFQDLNLTGLVLDASLRRDLMFARLSRALPLSFAITSALDGGMSLLEGLLGPDHVRAGRTTRTARFGQSLREALHGLTLPGARERVLSYIDLEVSLAWAASRVRELALRGESLGDPPPPGAWHTKPLALGPHLCMSVLPRSYDALKRELCPVPPDQLWARLRHAPLPKTRLIAALENEEPRLFVGRARLVRASRCEATVDHVTLELSPGFAPLLLALEGKRSADAVIKELRVTGAPPKTLVAVRAGLSTLVEQGMIHVVSQA